MDGRQLWCSQWKPVVCRLSVESESDFRERSIVSEREKERNNTANKALMGDSCGLFSENLWLVKCLWSATATFFCVDNWLD